MPISTQHSSNSSQFPSLRAHSLGLEVDIADRLCLEGVGLNGIAAVANIHVLAVPVLMEMDSSHCLRRITPNEAMAASLAAAMGLPASAVRMCSWLADSVNLLTAPASLAAATAVARIEAAGVKSAEIDRELGHNSLGTVDEPQLQQCIIWVGVTSGSVSQTADLARRARLWALSGPQAFTLDCPLPDSSDSFSVTAHVLDAGMPWSTAQCAAYTARAAVVSTHVAKDPSFTNFYVAPWRTTPSSEPELLLVTWASIGSKPTAKAWHIPATARLDLLISRLEEALPNQGLQRVTDQGAALLANIRAGMKTVLLGEKVIPLAWERID